MHTKKPRTLNLNLSTCCVLVELTGWSVEDLGVGEVNDPPPPPSDFRVPRLKDFVVLFAPHAAVAAGLSPAQCEWNSRQLAGLQGVWLAGGIDEQAMMQGKRLAAADLDVKRLQTNGLMVRA